MSVRVQRSATQRLLKFATSSFMVAQFPSNRKPFVAFGIVQPLLDHLKELYRQVDELEAQNQTWHRRSDLSTKIAHVRQVECRTHPQMYLFDPARRKDLAEEQVIPVQRL